MELIWGIKLNELLLLFKQLGLAILGATSLWGFIFSIRDKRNHKPKSFIIDDWISIKLFKLFSFGLVLSACSYFISIPAIKALAHEGSATPASIPEIVATFPIITLMYWILIGLTFLMIVLYQKNQEKFSYLITPFYAFGFLFAFFMTSFSAWRGTFDNIQIFHFMHGFHSIFTLGSVIVLDFLFLISYRSELLKQHIYSLFPTISKVIWAGLSLDFMSVFLIPDYFIATEKFLFVQTVITILIINGVFLSGPISRKMMASTKDGVRHITNGWRRMASVAGALSITSWLTITTIDFFKDLTLKYGELILIYLSFFMIAFIGHLIFEYTQSRKSPLTLN